MKKKNLSKYLILIVFSLILLLAGCKKPVANNDFELTILSINDFHGQLESTDNGAGAARIAEFIESKRSDNPEYTVLLSAGDTFQGTGISNIGFGKDVIEFMNMVDFDAMAIGNHEFDWGLDTVLAYRDGNIENGEAEFPFVNSNIRQKSTGERPDYIDEYTIIERNNVKIAVVSYLGPDQTGDIATKMVEDYEFLHPIEIIRDNVRKARTVDNADFVIVCCHDDTTGFTNLLATGEGDYEVDAIINAHSHNLYNKRAYRTHDETYVPIIQSGSSGEYVGVTTLKIDGDTKEVVDATVVNERMSKAKPEDEEVKSFVTALQEEYEPIFGRELCVAGSDVSRNSGTNWAVRALYEYSLREFGECDIAFINTGGIRKNAFPISKGTKVTVQHVYKIMPFDNTVKTTKMLGKDVLNALKITEAVYAGNVSIENGKYLINGVAIKDDQYYNVVAIDYIFDKTEYSFKNGIETVSTGILFRDVLIRELEIINENNEQWLG